MSVELLEKTNELIGLLQKNEFPHQIIKILISLNGSIDKDFDNPIKDHDMLETIEEKMPELEHASLLNYISTSQEVHKIRGNIVASINSLITITHGKLLLLLNDEEWCNLDQYYRSKSEFFFKEDMFRRDYFLDHEIVFFNSHPLLSFSMSQCKKTLFDILLSTKRYDSFEEVTFIKNLYGLLRSRLAIISNYAHSQDVNDVDEYVVRINNNRAIPTSRFIYDLGMLCKEVESNLFTFKKYSSIVKTDDYKNYMEQIEKNFLKWVASMTVTAAGDDFCALFGKYYCEAHVHNFEELLYKRKFPSLNIIFYKLLQVTRGMNTANEIMQTGNDLVVDLLKREVLDEEQEELDLDDPDSMCSEETVLERMHNLSSSDLNLLVKGLCNYVSERQWKRTIKSLFTKHHDPDVEYEPKLLHVPFSHKIIIFTKTQKPAVFETFVDAFAAWCYHLQRDYDGVLYDKKSGEKTICTPQLKKMFAL